MSTFGTRDLALFLPDQVGDALSLRHTDLESDKFEPLKPKIDKTTKVTRYFPNQAPKWVGDETDLNHSEIVVGIVDKKAEPAVDRRLARLAKVSSTSESNNEPRRQRRIYEAEVVADMNEDEEEDENDDGGGDEDGRTYNNEKEEGDYDDDDVKTRRDRILRRLTAQRDEQATLPIQPSSSSSSFGTTAKMKKDDSDNSESEYETDTDFSEDDDRQILKPIFIPRNKRETIREQEAKEEQDLLREKRREIEAEKRKVQTKSMVADCIRRKEEELVDNTDGDSDAGLPDDTDDLDDELEFENWKLREMARLKRDAEQREAAAMEKADLERRRHMTDEERMKEDQLLGRFQTKEKKKWKFMQKYYHKGVFYMDEDSLAKDGADVRTRDADAPTLEDRFNRENLPAVLQVKKFGMRGRTKYTHLLDQDTTVVKAGDTGQGWYGGPVGAGVMGQGNGYGASMAVPPTMYYEGGGGMGAGGMGGNVLGMIPVKMRAAEPIAEAYMRKRAGVGDIDGAGRLRKRTKE